MRCSQRPRRSDFVNTLAQQAVAVLETADPAEKARLARKVAATWRPGEITEVGNATPPARPARPAPRDGQPLGTTHTPSRPRDCAQTTPAIAEHRAGRIGASHYTAQDPKRYEVAQRAVVNE